MFDEKQIKMKIKSVVGVNRTKFGADWELQTKIG